MCGEKTICFIVNKAGFCYPGFMKNVLKYYIRFIVLLFPIFYMPFVVDGFGFGKTWFLGATALIGLVLWMMDFLINRKVEIKTSWPFWVGLVFTIWSTVSFFVKLTPGGKMDSIMNPLGLGNIVSLFIWFFLWQQVSDREEFKKQLSFLTVSGVITGIASLLAFMVPSAKLPLSLPKENPIISVGAGFSLSGSMLAECIFIVFLAVEWVKRLLAKLKVKDDPSAYLKEAIATAFFGLILFLDIYKIVKLGWAVLDGYSAWVIAVQTFMRSPIFGLGIGNFLHGFNLYRPISYNMTQFWSTAFSGSSMGILNIWTETGIVGLVIILWFVSGFLKRRKHVGFWQVALLLAATLFLPLTPVTLFLLALVVANRLFDVKENKLKLNVGEKDVNIMPWIMSAVLFVGVAISGYWWSRIISGEVFYRQSLLAASKNDGASTYTLQIKAIGANPYVANYRKTYSQTNLAIAQTLLTNKDITDDDKQKASTLIQQSVREAKAAISLEGDNANYWANLAVIYKSLVGVVDGSADWSFQAYQQAVTLDPANPLIALDMGGLLFAANKFDDADRVFEQVVTDKSDYANGWYNWAYTAKNNNRLDLAVSRLQQALKLVPADSGDYDKANEELNAWKKQLDEAVKKQQSQQQQQQQSQQKQPETLKTPDAIPTMGQEQKVNVSASDLQPPADQNLAPAISITPSVERQNSPSPSTSPVLPQGN